jgi:hypothetical protein
MSEGLSDDLPDPDEFRREMARVDDDFATARRLISAYAADDHQGLAAALAEVHRSGRGSKVLMAVVVQATDFGQLLLGDNFQAWIDGAAMSQLDVAAQDQRDLDGE